MVQENAAPEDTEDQVGSPPDQGGAPETVDREDDIQRRLSQQGRETAEARRRAELLERQNAQDQRRISELEAGMRLLTANLTEQQRAAQAEAQRRMDEELSRLPPQDRLERKIQLLGERIDGLQRTAVPPAQPAPASPSPSQPQQPRESDQAYMERRVREMVREVATDFGVTPDLDQLTDQDWESEDGFYRAIVKQAASGSQNGGSVPKKPPANETAAQTRERIKQEVRQEMGVSSPASPRPSGRRGTHPATSEDVQKAASAYDSKLGPKANIARLKALRESLG